jgi:hypothetical protein
MKTFDKAILALLQQRTDEADTLFKQFVTAQLNEDADTPDDQLSGDLDDEDTDEEPGLTEDGVPPMEVAPGEAPKKVDQNALPRELYIHSFDVSRRFAKVFNYHRGEQQTDQQVIDNFKTNGHCFFIVKFRVTQPYNISFYKLDNEYFALFHDKDTPDRFEKLHFYDADEVDNFMHSF